MNILFDNLETLIDAPNGIEKARELILQLAIQGKLTKQDPNDEPTSELLKKIKKEKERLISDGKIKAQIEIPTVRDEEKPFNIPYSWSLIRLGNVCNFEQGIQIDLHKQSKIKDSDLVRFLRIIDFTQEIDEYRYIEDPGEKYHINKNDLVMVRYGTVGFIGTGKEGVLANNLFKIKYYLIDKWYLYYFFKTPYFFSELLKSTQGVALPAIKFSFMNALIFSLPPLNEQKRIVEKVNSLMALLAELEAKRELRNQKRIKINNASLDKLLTSKDDKELKTNWKRIEENFRTLFSVPENLDKLKQAILQLAVQGKLVKQDPKDEPASELLKKIKKEKEKLITEGKIKKQKELPPIKEEEKPFELPKGWEWVRLIEVYDVRDGTHDTPKYVAKGFPLVTSKNIYTGKLDFSDIKFISEEDHRNICLRSKVDEDDILFAMIGSIGNPVIVDTTKEFSIKNVALFKYYFRDLSVPKYLHLFLNGIASKMRSEASGAVQSFVSLAFLRKYAFPLPPFNEQKRIVEKVNELMSLCNSLEEMLTKKEATADKLVGAIVNTVTTEDKKKLKREQMIKDILVKHKKALTKLS